MPQIFVRSKISRISATTNNKRGGREPDEYHKRLRITVLERSMHPCIAQTYKTRLIARNHQLVLLIFNNIL